MAVGSALFLALGLCSYAGCAGTAGSDIPRAPWVQLEKYESRGAEVVVWVELDGSYKGHRFQTAFKGQLGAEQVTRLRELFGDGLLAIYRADALPSDGTVNLEGTAELPIYRIVVRKEGAVIHPGDERMSIYVSDRVAHRETEALLHETNAIIDRAGAGN